MQHAFYIIIVNITVAAPDYVTLDLRCGPWDYPHRMLQSNKICL